MRFVKAILIIYMYVDSQIKVKRQSIFRDVQFYNFTFPSLFGHVGDGGQS